MSSLFLSDDKFYYLKLKAEVSIKKVFRVGIFTGNFHFRRFPYRRMKFMTENGSELNIIATTQQIVFYVTDSLLSPLVTKSVGDHVV
jgi:hypothetical protein